MSGSNYPILEYTPIRPPLVMMEQTVKWKPNKIELAPDCPRCSSSNTKFCYYNNYNVSQPRYFCKACRRYWTKGGFLRNVPIGGGCRKSRRGRSVRQPPSVEPADSGGSLAKYADQNEENNEASTEVGMRDGTVFECGKSMTEIQQVHEYIDGQDFGYEGFDGLDVGGVFGGELWSGGTSYGLELPLMQLQEFEVFASDDQIGMSENLVSTDNWASFDLSGYDNF